MVRCLDCRQDKAQQVLVLEWLRGGPLLDSLADVQPCYSAQHAAGIFRQVGPVSSSGKFVSRSE